MHVSRRSLLLGTAPAAAALAIAGCTTAQLAQFQAQWSNFVDQVNLILAKGCGALPGFTATANSIEAVVAAFYPTGAAAIAAGAAAVQAVAGAICSTVPVAPPAVLSGRLKANSARGLRTIIGNVTVNGRVIPITGYAVH